jgi:fatty acid desaturase
LAVYWRFLLVSFLMAYANFRIADKTKSNAPMTLIAMFALAGACALILYYEFVTAPRDMICIIAIYAILSFCAWLYASTHKKKKKWLIEVLK